MDGALKKETFINPTIGKLNLCGCFLSQKNLSHVIVLVVTHRRCLTITPAAFTHSCDATQETVGIRESNLIISCHHVLLQGYMMDEDSNPQPNPDIFQLTIGALYDFGIIFFAFPKRVIFLSNMTPTNKTYSIYRIRRFHAL